MVGHEPTCNPDQDTEDLASFLFRSSSLGRTDGSESRLASLATTSSYSFLCFLACLVARATEYRTSLLD